MDNKVIGTIGELAFTMKALTHGFHIATPINTSSVYDLILDGGKLHKIQVKTTSLEEARKNGFSFTLGRGSKAKTKYSIGDIDFFALYVQPLDIFYIIPINTVRTIKVRVYPDKLDHKYSKYKEAWHLFFS